VEFGQGLGALPPNSSGPELGAVLRWWRVVLVAGCSGCQVQHWPHGTHLHAWHEDVLPCMVLWLTGGPRSL
jgi:hypothetical protein